MEVKVINASNFEALANGDKPLLIDFYADWCGPCRMLAPVIAEIAAEHPELEVGKVNVDEASALASRFGVMSIPYVVLVKKGEAVASSLGYRTKEALLAALGI